MAITVKRKEGESLSGFLYRVNRRIQKSGVLLEARKLRRRGGKSSRNVRHNSALQRTRMQREIQGFLKHGMPLEESIDRARKLLRGIIKK